MSKYKSGKEIALSAMKKELTRLSRLADKANAEVDEYLNIGSEMLEIHEEFSEIVKSKEHDSHIIKKLEVLKDRRDRAQKMLDKDLMKLLDKQHKAKIERDSLLQEIQTTEFRFSLRQKAS